MFLLLKTIAETVRCIKAVDDFYEDGSQAETFLVADTCVSV